MDKKLEAGQIVNRLGKYMYKHLDGAYKITYSPMSCDVYLRMYYQVPNEGDTLDEMKFDISLTSYQNKVRINVTEITDFEKTIGHAVFKPEELENLEEALHVIYAKVCHYIEKEYADYDFVF